MNKRQDLLAQILILSFVGLGFEQVFSWALRGYLTLGGFLLFIPFLLGNVAFIILILRACGYWYWFHTPSPSEDPSADTQGSGSTGPR